jgi:hypothetical protein
MESLLQDLGGLLRLAAITGEAFLRCEAATLSGFGLAFLVGFGGSWPIYVIVVYLRIISISIRWSTSTEMSSRAS